MMLPLLQSVVSAFASAHYDVEPFKTIDKRADLFGGYSLVNTDSSTAQIAW